MDANIRYILYGKNKNNDKLRPDLFAIGGSLPDWQEYEKFEKAHSKSTKVGEKFMVPIPHKLHSMTIEETEKYIDSLGKHLFGNKPFFGVCHKLQGENGTNMHIHYRFGTRDKIPAAEMDYKKYKRDVWLTRDGKLAKSKAERFECIHRKGEYKFDEHFNFIPDKDPYTAKDRATYSKYYFNTLNDRAKDFNATNYDIKPQKVWYSYIHKGYDLKNAKYKDKVEYNEIAKECNTLLNSMQAQGGDARSLYMSANQEHLHGKSYKSTENMRKVRGTIRNYLHEHNKLAKAINSAKDRYNANDEFLEKFIEARDNFQQAKKNNTGFLTKLGINSKEFNQTLDRLLELGNQYSRQKQRGFANSNQLIEYITDEQSNLREEVEFLLKKLNNLMTSDEVTHDITPVDWTQIFNDRRRDIEIKKTARLEALEARRMDFRHKRLYDIPFLPKSFILPEISRRTQALSVVNPEIIKPKLFKTPLIERSDGDLKVEKNRNREPSIDKTAKSKQVEPDKLSTIEQMRRLNDQYLGRNKDPRRNEYDTNKAPKGRSR